MLAAILGLALLPLQTDGAAVLSPSYDTFLDAETPDENYGRDAALVAGPKKVVLVRFPGVGSRLDPAKPVTAARLELRLLSGGPIRLKSAARVVRAWGEGTGRRLLPTASAQTLGGATWNHARTGPGGEKWQRGGAGGGEDSTPVAGTSLVQSDDRVLVTGLGPAVQSALDDPDGDFGFRLEFESECVFASSEITEFEPRLVVEQGTEAVQPKLRLSALYAKPEGSLAVRVLNPGGAVAGLQLEWSSQGRKLGTADVDVPAQSSVELAAPAAPDGSAGKMFEATLLMGTRKVSSARGFWGGQPVPVAEDDLVDGTAARLARMLNDEAMPFSRYSFAAEGSPLRFLPVLVAERPKGTAAERGQSAARATLPAELFGPGEPGAFAWCADTRDDVFLPPSRWRPAYRWLPRGPEDPVLPERGWLGPGEVLFHQTVGSGKPLRRPKRLAVFVRALDGQGLAGVALKLEGGSMSGGATTNDQGLAMFELPEADAGFPGLHKLTATKAGASATADFPAWLALVESARLGGRDPIVEVGLMLLRPTPDQSADVAAFKAVTTNDGRLPAATAAVVDGDASTVLEVGPGGWFEVDLGRDRVVASVELTTVGEPFSSFVVSFGRTGSPAGSGSPWVTESYGVERAAQFGSEANGQVVVQYSATASLARRVRITNRGSAPVRVARLRVFGPPAG